MKKILFKCTLLACYLAFPTLIFAQTDSGSESQSNLFTWTHNFTKRTDIIPSGSNVSKKSNSVSLSILYDNVPFFVNSDWLINATSGGYSGTKLIEEGTNYIRIGKGNTSNNSRINSLEFLCSESCSNGFGFRDLKISKINIKFKSKYSQYNFQVNLNNDFTQSQTVKNTYINTFSFNCDNTLLTESLEILIEDTYKPTIIQERYLDLYSLSVEYSFPDEAPVITPEKDKSVYLSGKDVFNISHPYRDAEFFYTIDGSDPREGNGIPCGKSFSIPSGGQKNLQVAAKLSYLGNSVWSQVASMPVNLVECDEIIPEYVTSASSTLSNDNLYNTYALSGVTVSDNNNLIILDNSASVKCGLQTSVSESGTFYKSISIKGLRALSAADSPSYLNVYGSQVPYSSDFSSGDSKGEDEFALLSFPAVPDASEDMVFTASIPGNFNYLSVRPSDGAKISFSNIIFPLSNAPTAYVSDVYDAESHKIKTAFSSYDRVTVAGYLKVINFGKEDSKNFAHLQDPDGQSVKIYFDSSKEIAPDQIIQNLSFMPDLSQGSYLVGDNADWDEAITFRHVSGIYPLAEGQSLELLALPLSADNISSLAGQYVSFTGPFDDISGLDIPVSNIIYKDFYSNLTLLDGAVSPLADAYSQPISEGIKAFNRHIWLTRHLEDLKEGETNQYTFYGVLEPSAASDSPQETGLSAAQPIAKLFINKATTSNGGIVTGIEDITVNPDELQPEYFNLQGIKVSVPEKGRLYILRQGTKVSKILY